MALLSNEIFVGSVSSPLYYFTNERLTDSSNQGVFAVDVIGNELSVDQFSVVVRYTRRYQLYVTSDGKIYKTADNKLYSMRRRNYPENIKDYLKELPYGTPVWWYVGGSFYTKGYLKSIDRVSKYGFKLTCTSGVGLLDASMHTGGLYQADAFPDVLASVIGGAFTYTVSQAVQDTARVYGRLPYDTRRNNLHRLLFSTGAVLQKGDNETDYVIDYLPDTVIEVPPSRVALQGSVDYQLPSNAAEITEHSFFLNGSEQYEMLFDSQGVVTSDLLIVFDSPVANDNDNPLQTTGTLTISESNINYAIVSGVGTLSGKKYTHTTQVTSLVNNPNNDPERVRRVTENELITALNSRNVARRVLSFYQSAKQVKAKIMLDGERCGQLIRMTDSFGDVTQAYLAKMDTLVTSVIGAQCQLVEGFQPGNNGNYFLHRQEISESGTWTVPDGVTFVRIALIGGGAGGQGGYDGEKGADGIYDEWMKPDGELYSAIDYPTYDFYSVVYLSDGSQRIPAGGLTGDAGDPAKVYVIERNVTPGEVITFSVGAGGNGGARNGGIGSAGTPTTASSTSVGNVSSEDGLVSQGYFDPMNGVLMAAPGRAGVVGGNGGRTDSIDLRGFHGGSGLPGENCGEFVGGAGGVGIITGQYAGYDMSASGGGGGGAAYGADGGAGSPGTYTPRQPIDEYTSWPERYQSGDGGDGANALPPPKPAYGWGGGGGNGGGAGGNTGGVSAAGYNWTPSTSIGIGHGGAAGQGSVGGEGGDGVVIIYW